MTTINPPFGIKTHIPPRATALRKKTQKSTGNLIDRIKTGYEVENSIRTQALQMVVQINCCQKRYQDDIYVTVEPDHYFRKQRNYNTREKYSSDFPIHVPLSTAFDV